MRLRLKPLSLILSLVLLLVWAAPVGSHAQAHAAHGAPSSAAGVEVEAPPSEPSQSHAETPCICATLCVAPAPTLGADGVRFLPPRKLVFALDDVDAETHVLDGPLKPPRV